MNNDTTLGDFVNRVTSQELARLMDLRPSTVRSWIIDGVPSIHREQLKRIALTHQVDLTNQNMNGRGRVGQKRLNNNHPTGDY